jgi:hypothetical protein
MKPVSWYVKHVPGAWREAPKWNWIASWPGGPTPGVGQGRTASPAESRTSCCGGRTRTDFQAVTSRDEADFEEPVPVDRPHARSLTVGECPSHAW